MTPAAKRRAVTVELTAPTETILVVDDEPAIRDHVAGLLAARGFQVVVAADAREAMELAQRQRVQLVITDLDLPDVTGFELLAQLRNDPATRDVPVMFLSGYSQPACKVAALDGGACDYLTKPIDSGELVARVRAHVRQAERTAALSYQACADELTGVLNRRGLNSHLERLLARSRRDGSPVSLLLVDLDRFKAINDTHGHAFGDTVLKRVAQALLAALRTEDLVARVGGDEFVVVLANCESRVAARAVARIRHDLARLRFDGWRGGIDASIGACSARGAGLDATRLIDQADRSMYQVKRTRAA